MKLVAKVNVQHSRKPDEQGKLTGEPIVAGPGQAFDTDEATAQVLIANGSAATPADYERQNRAGQDAEARIAELETELAATKAERDQLAADQAAGGSTTPSGAPEPKQGKLPEDFPGKAALDAAGYDTYAKVRKVDDLTAVPGVGAATADKIKAAL